MCAKYPELVRAVRWDHYCYQYQRVASHDFYHALMVAQYAVIIAEEPRTGELAWIAGLCHNTDRLFGCDGCVVAEQVERYLDSCPGVGSDERALVVDAVVKHSRKNEPDDSPVLVSLKDADRLANLGAQAVIRSAQHYATLSPFDPRFVEADDPQASYRDPRTVLRDVRECFVWQEWLRTERARQLAAPHFAWLQSFVDNLAQQLRETGLLPLPPELVPVCG